jgi:ketosteroid isomerase-like protein
MAEPDKKTGRWRSKFAAKKIEFAPDAPPSKDARSALNSGIAAACATVIPVILAVTRPLTGIPWWLAPLLWLVVGLPFTIRAIFRGKYEGDVIKAGMAPKRGKQFTNAALFLGLGSAGLAALYLLMLLVFATLPAPKLPGNYGDAQQTFNAYLNAVRSGDFDAYLNCFDSKTREAKDQSVEGTEDEQRQAFRGKLRAAFEELRKRRDSQDITLNRVEYSDGGSTARDANRADLRVHCADKSRSLETDVSMTMTREADGWKVAVSEL